MSMDAQAVNDKFLKVVTSRGADGVLGLSRSFRVIDSDKSGAVSLSEFALAMKRFQVDLKEKEIEALFNMYDRDNSGTVSAEEFMRGIRSKLSPLRKDLVDKAFALMDKDGSGELTFQDLKDRYDTSSQRKVTSGQQSHEGAVQQFLNTFEGEQGNKDGIVTKQEWDDYYIGLSSNIDSDDFFGVMMSNAWGIDFLPEATIKVFVKNIRDKAAQKANDSNPKMVVKKTFAFFDSNKSKTVDLVEFRQAMNSLIPGMTEKEQELLFKKFDLDDSGEISYDEFIEFVFPDGK